MLKRSGLFKKKELIDAAREYCDLYDGKVPYLEVAISKVCYVVFERAGVVWVFKEFIK